MICSIMVVLYNRLELTKQTFDNLFETTNVDFRLIIVDNNSTDGTVEYINELQEYFKSGKIICPYLKDIHVQFNKENKGIIIGRNQALKISDEFSDDFLATIDNDVLLPENWLRECIGILQANSKYGMIGVNFEERSFPLITQNGYTFQTKHEGNLGTACAVFPKSLHKLLGYYSTEYKLYGCEDSDWGMRTRVVGKNLGYIKENGIHLGVGENDKGEYRKFKTESHNKNVDLFRKNCALYVQGKKSYYIPFKDK